MDTMKPVPFIQHLIKTRLHQKREQKIFLIRTIFTLYHAAKGSDLPLEWFGDTFDKLYDMKVEQLESLDAQ